MELKTKRLNVVSWAIISGVIGILVGIASLIIAIYGVNAKESTRLTSEFAVNASTSISETRTHWQKGNAYYGVNQTEGTVKTKYSIYYKKNSGSYVLEWGNGYCNANNTYYGEWFMHSTNGVDKYAYKLIKETNKNVKSKMIIDLMLL